MGDQGALRQQQRVDGADAKVTILTPTYNKPRHILECAESVLNQNFKDWHWWIALDGPTQETYDAVKSILNKKVWVFNTPFSEGANRFAFHRPAYIVNNIYPCIPTPYIYFLADDDLLHPDGLGSLVTALDMNPTWDIVYGNCEVHNELPDHTYRHMADCYAGRDVGLGTGILPDCLLDGGQILQTKRSWDALGSWRLPTDIADAAHNDGIYLNKLAELFTFRYVPTPLLIHRRTPLSTYHRHGLEQT